MFTKNAALLMSLKRQKILPVHISITNLYAELYYFGLHPLQKGM